MRTLDRNKKAFSYCLFFEEAEQFDENGRFVGYGSSYSDPIEVKGNISAGMSDITAQQFGINNKVDKTIVLSGTDWEVSETSVLFVDKAYSTDADGKPEYDYVVAGIVKSINSTTIAIKKVR